MPSDNVINFAKRFLNEMYSEPIQVYHEMLENLLEELENKGDPEPYEVHLAENLYQYLEKMKTLETNLNGYVKGKRENLPGNKLSSLMKFGDKDKYFDIY